MADKLPWSNQVTEYGEEHVITYLRLLDADASGARKEEKVRIVLGIGDANEPERARQGPVRFNIPALFRSPNSCSESQVF